MKRLIITLFLALAPTVAMADASSLQVTGTGVSSPTGAASTLQPSSTGSLQSRNDSASSTGSGSNASDFTAQGGSNLQAAPTSDAVNNYLNGELVGGPQGKPASSASNDSGASLLDWIATILLLAVVAVAGSYYANRQRRLARGALTAEMPLETQSEAAPLTSDVAAAVEEREREPVKGAGKQAQAKRKAKAKGKAAKKKARKR